MNIFTRKKKKGLDAMNTEPGYRGKKKKQASKQANKNKNRQTNKQKQKQTNIYNPSLHQYIDDFMEIPPRVH